VTTNGLRVVLTTDAVGGVWVFATTLASALAARGAQVLLVTQGPPPALDQLDGLRAQPGIELATTDFDLEWMDPEGRDYARARIGLAALARRYRPDVIHLNGYREAAGDWTAPVLVTAHSCVRSWWRACRDGEPDEARWRAYITNVAAGLTLADAWTAPTIWFRDQMQVLYDPPCSGDVIHNGIEVDWTITPKEPFILAAGRLWDEAKNVSALVGVASCVPWPIWVAGPQRLGDKSVERGGSLRMLGQLSHLELVALMHRAGVFVSPALYEPFGLAVLEAAASGCALVLADIPSLRELWAGAALFFNPRDSGALAEKLALVCGDAVLQRRLRTAAIRRARRYQADAMVDQYQNLYRTLLDRRARPPRIAGWPMQHGMAP